MNNVIINGIIIPIVFKLIIIEILLAFSIVYLDFLAFSFFVILFFAKMLLIFLFREPFPCVTGDYIYISPCGGQIKDINITKNHPLLGSTNVTYKYIKIQSGLTDYYSKFSPVNGRIKKLNWIDHKINNRTIKSLLITFEIEENKIVLMYIKPDSFVSKSIIIEKKEGTLIKQGDYICNVPFGSQVVLYFEENTEIIPLLRSSLCPFSIISY